MINFNVINEIICILFFTLDFGNQTLSTLGAQFTWDWLQCKRPLPTLPSTPTPFGLLPLSYCTSKRACPRREKAYLQGPGTQPKASHQHSAVGKVLLDLVWASCTWLEKGRKQGHQQGSMAAGPRKGILGAIKVLTDKTVPSHSAEVRTHSFQDKDSRLLIP